MTSHTLTPRRMLSRLSVGLPQAAFAVMLALLFAVIVPASFAQESVKRVTFDIPAGDAAKALRQFSAQSGQQLLYSNEDLTGVTTNEVKGRLGIQDALNRLLENTPLVSSRDERNGAVAVGRKADPNAGRAIAKSSDRPVNDSEKKEDKLLKLDTFTVTGTRIRGGQPSSPVVTIQQEEMRLSGYTNLGEVIRALPQNFSGGQNPGVAVGATTGAYNGNTNLTGGSTLNLRGLGSDATLTLLNGSRLPYDGARQSIDVSVIPVAAIERVEILLDGASAIYGSDAVGGVANIILKRDYEGAELSARYGAATDGGYEQQQYTAVGGTHWGSGGFLITGDYSDTDSVKARQRDYLRQLTNQNVTIYPQQTQKNGLFSGHQEIGPSVRFNLDAFYTKRAQENLEQTSASSLRIADLDSSIWGVSPSLNIALPGDWSARPYGAFGRNQGERITTSFSTATSAQTGKSRNEYSGDMQSAGAELEGPLFTLPGGNLRASTGAGYRKTSLDLKTVDMITGAVSGVLAAHDSSVFVFGEVNLPLVSESQHIPLITRFSLNLALRHENYQSFGTSTTPKIGANWGLAPGFEIKASWGKSFKVPTLVEQYSDTFLALYPGEYFGGAAGSQVLALFGSNPHLTPEKAEVITAGFVAQPKFLPGFRLEFGYFGIDYKDRVSTPLDNLFAALSNPVYAEFVTLNPAIAQQNAAFSAVPQAVGTFLPGFNAVGAPYDPARVIAILDGRLANASNQRVNGIDLNTRYTTVVWGGDLTLKGNANWIIKGTRKVTSLTPEQPAAGVNFWPAKFKGTLGVGWSRNGLSLNANVNHIAGIYDRSVTPNIKRSSMTTLDLVVDYQAKLPVVGDVGFNLAVTNFFNQAPPFLQPPSLPNFLVNYDSTNYSALGRVVSATVTKRF